MSRLNSTLIDRNKLFSEDHGHKCHERNAIRCELAAVARWLIHAGRNYLDYKVILKFRRQYEIGIDKIEFKSWMLILFSFIALYIHVSSRLVRLASFNFISHRPAHPHSRDKTIHTVVISREILVDIDRNSVQEMNMAYLRQPLIPKLEHFRFLREWKALLRRIIL